MKNINHLQSDVITVFKSYEKTGTIPWDEMVASRDLIVQIGSLNKLLMQLSGERHAKGMDEALILKKVADEIVDIIADTLFIAYKLDIDIDLEWEEMIYRDKRKVEERCIA